jgi:protein involved in polysaccharide export with SLBB domain
VALVAAGLVLMAALAPAQESVTVQQAAEAARSATPAQQAEAIKSLTPAQQSAISQELGKTPGSISPEAIKALQSRPEFQGLSPEEVARGRELLQRQQTEKARDVAPEKAKEAVPDKAREAPRDQAKDQPRQTQKEGEAKDKAPETQKQVLGESPKGETLFERAQNIGKYQDVSLALRPFGHDFFRDAAVKVITDRKDIPVHMKYVVGPGDEVRIALWGRINATHTLTIDRDGKITIPSIGPLTVAGMTFEEMSAYLIKQAEQITGTNVDVSMGALRTIPIFILGDVRRPGAYTIGAFATITDALLLAGGPTEIGSMRNIELRRKDKVIQTFDLYDLLLKGDKSKDVVLHAGDIVFVPVIGSYVGVAGNVKRPALYELTNNKSLAYLFALAGGIIPTAYTQQIQVERTIKNEKQVVIDIDDKHLEQAKSVMLQDADLVKVFSIVDRDVNVVYLNGNVKRGGKYAMAPGMRLRDILRDANDLMPDTHFDYALIKRLQPPAMDPLLIPFNLGDLLLRNDPASNLLLQPLDSVYIFSTPFFKDKRFFTVSGEVRKGGRFDLSLNSRIKDAILTAGDLTKDAYLKKGEVVRVGPNREYRTLYFDVAKAMTGDPAENLLLEDEDQIIVHSLYEEQWKETVTVRGEVKKPGSVVLTEGMRVSDLIFKAGGQTRDTLLDQAELYRTDWKTKEITLHSIHLGRALAGDPAANVELKDLDRLVVHSIWEKTYRKTVAVEGDVLKPGAYDMADNMTVRDLVFAAGSLLESASREEAELSSHIVDKKGQAQVVHRKINLTLALAGDPEHNKRLEPYDRLFIKRVPDWRYESYITLAGEVKYPGRYILKKDEKLSAVIERAGGYKDGAYLRGAYFTRERVRELQQQGLVEMAERLERELLSASGTISTAASGDEVTALKAEFEQRKKFIDSLRKIKATGRMTIFLSHLRLLKGSEYDIELENGDTLMIPKKNNIVNVVGSVMTQGTLLHSEKLDYNDYINESGGYARYADVDNTFVLKVDGSARKLARGFLNWSNQRDRWELASFGESPRTIEPGDTIIVPERVDRIAWLREIKDITQILMNAAVTAGVFKALF